MTRLSVWVAFTIGYSTLIAFASVRADIYEWEYINPMDPSQGKQESNIVVPGGSGVNAVPGANLTSRNLTQAYLIGKNLTNSTQFFTNLTNADMTGANLTGAKFNDANLSQSNLTNATLASAQLFGANLTNANIRGARFESTVGLSATQFYSTASYQTHDLTGTKLISQNLTGWNLKDQILTSSEFTSSNLTNVDFSNSNLENTVLANANLATTNLTSTNIRGANFFTTGITSAQLYSTTSYQAGDLSGVSLGQNDLTGWNFESQDLAGASFYLATLADADFAGANIHHANFRDTTSRGFQSDQLYSTAGYQAGDLRGIVLAQNNLTGWSFADQNLEGADFSEAILTDADFAGATIKGVAFYTAFYLGGLTAEEFFSTASYISGDLTNLNIEVFPAYGWDLSSKNFAGSRIRRGLFDNANLRDSNLTNTSFTASTYLGANMSGVDARGAFGNYNGAIVKNLIRSNGTVAGLDLADGEKLLIRDYDGDPSRNPPLAPISVRVQDHFAMSGTGEMRMIFEADAWNSTISFDPGIPVDLGGILDLNFKEDVNILSQVGRTLDLFDWTGVAPTGTFTVESPYEWDLTNLYTTGEVKLLSVNSLPGDFDGDGDVDGRDYLAWQRDSTLGSLTAWKANYGDSVGGLSSFVAVPEPTAYSLLILAFLSQELVHSRRFSRNI